MSLLSRIASTTSLKHAALALAQTEANPDSESESASSSSCTVTDTDFDRKQNYTYAQSCNESSDDFSDNVNASAGRKRVSSNHSRARIDESTVSPSHAKRLKKSRQYQQRKRTAEAVAAVCTDEELQEMLLSKQGQDRFSKTASMLRGGADNIASINVELQAAKAVQELVAELPAKSTHKQAIVAKLRGKFDTKKEFHLWFKNISTRYGRRAEHIAKRLDQERSTGDTEARIDIFSQVRIDHETRDAITERERRITGKVILENMGAKSGRDTLYWYGTLDSFYENYRSTTFPNIYAQMVSDAGSIERLVADMKGGKWVVQNAQAYICKGRCSTACRHFYQPRTRPTLNKMLADSDISFRCITKTVPCHWHDNWDRWKAELAREEAKQEGENRDLKLIQKLKVRVARAKKHDDCYQVQRR